MGRLYNRSASKMNDDGDGMALLAEHGQVGSNTAEAHATDAFMRMLKEDAWRKDRMSMGDNHGWRVAVAVEGTILPVLFREPLFVGCIVGFVILRVLALLGIVHTDPDVQFRGTSMLGAAVTFFLVFYASQTFTRFQAQYFHARDAGGSIHAFAMLARAALPHDRAVRLVRQLNAAQMMAFIGLEEGCDADFAKGFNGAFHILTPSEMKTVLAMDINTAGGMAALLQWVLDDLSTAIQTGELSEIRAMPLSEKVLAVKGSLSRLFHYSNQQIPFAYVHLATLLSYVYLPLLSVTLAIAPINHAERVLWEFQNAMALIFTCAFVLGLRETARIMSDPFGNDDYDLPAISFGIATIKKCNAIMNLRGPDSPHHATTDAQAGFGYGACDSDMV